MLKKPKPKVTVIRSGEVVDPRSTQIRSEQSSKLRKDNATVLHKVSTSDDLKLLSKKPEAIYSAGKRIKCRECSRISPTPRMFRYPQSSHGMIILCETCDEETEIRSFYNLDAMDSPRIRKQYKVE